MGRKGRSSARADKVLEDRQKMSGKGLLKSNVVYYIDMMYM